MKKSRKKGITQETIRCPYCGSPAVLRSADGIYYDNSRDMKLYVCKNYPQCDSYVRVHAGTNIPAGTMANRRLRALRAEAHRYFDRLYKSGYMTKDDAYHWLAGILDAPLSQAHIGYLGEYYCQVVIDESRKLLERKRIRFPAHRGSARKGVEAACG